MSLSRFNPLLSNIIITFVDAEFDIAEAKKLICIRVFDSNPLPVDVLLSQQGNVVKVDTPEVNLVPLTWPELA